MISRIGCRLQIMQFDNYFYLVFHSYTLFFLCRPVSFNNCYRRMSFQSIAWKWTLKIIETVWRVWTRPCNAIYVWPGRTCYMDVLYQCSGTRWSFKMYICADHRFRSIRVLHVSRSISQGFWIKTQLVEWQLRCGFFTTEHWMLVIEQCYRQSLNAYCYVYLFNWFPKLGKFFASPTIFELERPILHKSQPRNYISFTNQQYSPKTFKIQSQQ